MKWLFSKSKNSPDSRVALAFQADGLAWAFSRGQTVDRCGYVADVSLDSSSGLKGLLEQEQLEKHPCTLVLPTSEYQILRLEAPQVESEEMAAAVKWRVKDMLDYPVEEAAIDYFLLPDDAYRGRQKILYAAVLRKDRLRTLVNNLVEASLAVDRVEIPELTAQRLLNWVMAKGQVTRNDQATPLVPDGKGIALVSLAKTDGFINLSQGGYIYLSRRVNFGSHRLAQLAASAENTAAYDTLLLEVQRSMDYYESQLGKGVIKQLWLSPLTAALAPIASYLSEALRVTAKIIPIETLMPCVAHIEPEQRGTCLSAIGACLEPHPAPLADS